MKGLLTLTTLWANSADNKLIVFLYFPEIRQTFHVNFLPMETICLKYHTCILFPEKNKKKYFKISSAENFTQHANH